MIIKLQNGNTLKLSKEESDYLIWKKLSPKQKRQSRVNKAKAYLNSGPNITNFWNAFLSYIGNKDPKNPHLSTGTPSILPGRGTNPKTTQNVTKGIRTLEDYLRTTKVSAPKLEGTSHLRDSYATDRFLGGQIFESSLPEEAMRVQGHGMAKSSTILDALARLRYILDNGFEKGKTFYTAPLKLSEEGKQFGIYLGTTGGTPYFNGHFLITGKPGLMINSIDDISTIYINDAYQNEEALKAALKIKTYLQLTYPNKTFKLYSEGFKNGGTIKTANARKWKHQKGGLLKTGAEIGGTLGQTIVNTEAKRKGKRDSAHQWFKLRYGNVNWNNMKYIYSQMKKARIPYDTAIAVMGNIIHESQGDPHKRQIGGGPGYGLIQWNIGTQPGDTLEAQTAGIIQNIINPANQNNYWYHGGEGSGFKSGEEVRRYMNKKNNYEFSKKTKAFSDSLLRPGIPEMGDRIKSSKSLAALTDLFPEYLKGGQINE